MSFREFLRREAGPIQNKKDEICWCLGVERGHDPRQFPEELIEIELRLAEWIVKSGEQLRIEVISGEY